MNSKLVQPSYTAKKEDIKREWFLIDAKDYTLGRLASRIAKILQGKHKPTYTPYIDSGDFVVVVNAEKIKLSKDKKKTKYTEDTVVILEGSRKSLLNRCKVSTLKG